MIVAGFGFRSTATDQSLLDALAQATDVAVDRDGRCAQPTHLAVPSDKADADGFVALAAKLALPVVAVRPDQLAAIATLTQSTPVIVWRSVGSVAEAVALAACGEGATLPRPRVISRDRLATCALAMGGSR